MQGCAVRMLTRAGPLACAKPPLPSTEEVALAIERLTTNFAFIGLTERWAASICLLHVQFALGPCEAAEGINTRAHHHRNGTEAHNASKLHGFRDPYDGPLYDAARRLFERSMREHAITPAKCYSLNCPLPPADESE